MTGIQGPFVLYNPEGRKSSCRHEQNCHARLNPLRSRPYIGKLGRLTNKEIINYTINF